MDPIMDQMCGVTGTLKQSELLVVDYPKDEAIPQEVIVKLFQSLVIHEAAFLDGASLMESINQCIFTWEGSWESLESRSVAAGAGASNAEESAAAVDNTTSASSAEQIILAYCKSLVLSTSNQFRAVLAADIYEGEGE
jgi:hypothetical protein